MEYKKKLKWPVIGSFVVVLIMATVYYASITRAENLESVNQDSSFQTMVDFIKGLFVDIKLNDEENVALLNQNKEKISELTTTLNKDDNKVRLGSSLNRDLLDICLAKAEDEWTQLQKHYNDVLVQCINIDLGLNGEKLFNNEECNRQIEPYKQKDRLKIQVDKTECFNRYSERE